MKDFCVELKVCEACGALWLRAVDHGVYCRGCALWLSEFPASVAESLRVRGDRKTNNRETRTSQEQVKTASPALRLVFAGGSR
jgi:hypothetical protein